MDAIPYAHPYLRPRLWRGIWPPFSSLVLRECWANILFRCSKTEGHVVLSPPREELDLTDSEATSNFIQSNPIDAVVHCAAYVAGIASSTTTKHHSFDSNVSMGMNLIRACIQHDVATMLNVGSATVYPSEAPQPLSESSLGQGAFEGPIEGYALSKYVVYRACAMANEQHNVAFKTILPCNLFGPYDNFSLETGHMLPAILHRMHQAKEQGKRSNHDLGRWYSQAGISVCA